MPIPIQVLDKPEQPNIANIIKGDAESRSHVLLRRYVL